MSDKDRLSRDTAGVLGQRLTEGLSGQSRLVDLVLNELRRQILGGRFDPGDSLPSEAQLREAFGVGRSTVREALQGLIASGLVERRHSQLVVRNLAVAGGHEVDMAALAARLSVREVFETRKLLEVEGARLAASHPTEQGLDRLRSIIEAMDTQKPEAYHTRDLDFHKAIMTLGGNRVLADVYTSSIHLFFKLPAFWRIFGDRQGGGRDSGAVGGGKPGHEVLYEAIASGDPEQAAARMYEHIDRVERNLINHVATTDEQTETTPAESER